MNKIKQVYQWSPAVCNGVLGLLLILANQFLAPDYAQQIKSIVDGLIVLLSGAATYPQVSPIYKKG